ncbi:MAG: hypothetical protein P4L53_09470 [Candidatus Obscuribacterales bacterium]|nr:hypothetical protein [Candidatus Obscuribacterales bacterium]
MFSHAKMSRKKLGLLSIICCSIGLFGAIVEKTCAADTAANLEQTAGRVVSSKTIGIADLRKYPHTTIETEEKETKVKYTGVPLRLLLAEMLPDCKLDSMPEWKALTKRELVMELRGNDGFPALVTATEIAINKSGDRFLLAIEKDGKPLDVAPQLICPFDEARTRCVRGVVSLKIVSLR